MPAVRVNRKNSLTTALKTILFLNYIDTYIFLFQFVIKIRIVTAVNDVF